jgi:HPt (histidine-containing phosphotransfer) domain-containing protein
MVTTQKQAIYSQLGADADLSELVALFVDEMPERIATLEQAWSSGDLESLRRTAHQMKGAVGSYGFVQLTPLAAAVESAVREQAPEEQIVETLEELIAACRQVRAGLP